MRDKIPWMKKAKDFSSDSEDIYPDLDIIDMGDEIVVEIDIPGVDKRDIRIKSTKNSIEVSAERKDFAEDKEKDYYVYERTYEGYYRKFLLPVEIDTETISAKYENGVLKITADKTESDEEEIEVE